MSTNGILDFQNTNKVIFRGTDSNVVVDTSNASIGIGIQGTEKPGSNLHVIGDASISSNLKLTTDTSITVNSNVVTDFNGPHAREPKEVPLKKYPEIIFEEGKMDENRIIDTYTQAGYTVSASSFHTNATRDYHTWKVFDGSIANNTHAWLSGYVFPGSGDYNANSSGSSDELTGIVASSSGGVTSRYGAWLQLELPCKIKLSEAHLYGRYYAETQRIDAGYIYGSNNGTSWTQIGEISASGISSGNLSTYTDVQPLIIKSTDTTNSYKYFIVQATSLTHSSGYAGIGQLEYYGYEEDPPAGDISVDTTFKSVMNTPQTTGANVYVDAKLSSGFTNQVTGPTPVGTAATHDNTNKYWELNGQLTSNITVEANTFLEGDQPHAVSVWFNSSNLEANVSNTCVFSISDQEKLDSVNLDLQSNTWHNLTYAYQGEGGSRVTYLDGRKVAEDQAEDTFGDYPPFAMTRYSQGGYVVSVSSEYDTSYPIWEAFNNVWHNNGNTNGSDAWLSENATNYNGSDGLYSKSPPRNLGTGAHDGEWVKIEMPHKFKLNYITIYPRYQHDNKAPRDFIVYGSNDNVNWSPVLTKTGASITSSHVETGHTFSMDVYDTCYKYFGLVIRKLRSNTTFVAIAELKLYGHRENDLVRLPDPTNVLKYPHITMTGPAQRGYVASASSNSADAYSPWKAFDNDTSGDNGWTASGTPYSTSDGSYAGGTTYQTTVTGHTPTAVNGEFLQLELTHKIKPTKFRITSYTGNGSTGSGRQPKNGVFAGSNDGTNWVLLKSYTNQTSWTQGTFVEITPDTNTSNYYKYIRLIVTDVQSTTDGTVTIHGLEIYGTGVDSIPIQIGGGNIDKVANFRVYDKFVGEDQALEIWDAQKDEFGRAKSSMTLHKGRLGLGTEEPEGRLAVADEPHNLEEFPPGPMNGYKNYFEGHGEFCVINSTFQSAGQEGWKAFDGVYGVPGNGNIWIAGNPTYNTDGTSNGTSSINGEAGEYLILEMPYNVKMKSVLVYPRGANSSTVSYSNPPKNGKIWGKNGIDSVWEELTEYSNLDFGATITDNLDGQYPQEIQINAVKAYKYIAFQVQVSNHTLSDNSTYTNIRQLRYFGTREQGQSVLHDGKLTLTKNLDVPRIGPALDADDTPRRDRLVVEYNTSTNPTFEGAIRDTSGRGNDGVFYGGAMYDATEKAWTNTSQYGTGDYVYTKTHLTSGDFPFAMSFWVKMTQAYNGYMTMVMLGSNSTNKGIALDLYNAGSIYWYGKDGSHLLWNTAGTNQTSDIFPRGKWVHVVAVHHQGSGAATDDVYINGEIMPGTPSVNNPTGTNVINFNDNPELVIGARGVNASSAGSDFCPASYSNFKLYDVALTAEEVKTLYDMGRNGSVAKPQPLHIAAPLYAPGTICQVQIVHFPRENVAISTGATKTLTTFEFKPKFANSRLFFTLTIYCETGSIYWNIHLYRNDSDKITSHTSGVYGIVSQNYSSVGSGHQVRVGQGYDDPNTSEYQKYTVKFINDTQGAADVLGVNGPHLLKIEEICQ